jgi:hypothetical protein
MLTSLNFDYDFNGETYHISLNTYDVLYIAAKAMQEHLNEVTRTTRAYQNFADASTQASPRKLKRLRDWILSAMDTNNPQKLRWANQAAPLQYSYFHINDRIIRFAHTDKYCADMEIVRDPIAFDITSGYTHQSIANFLGTRPDVNLREHNFLWFIAYWVRTFQGQAYLERIGLVPDRIRYEYLQRYFDTNIYQGPNHEYDKAVATTIRGLVNGKVITGLSSYLDGVPLLTSLLFLAEFARNYMSLYSSLILLDFIVARITYGNANLKQYRWYDILWHTKADIEPVHDIHGAACLHRNWGGKHSMTHDNSYTEQPKDNKNQVIQYDLAWPLTISRQKEASLLTRWLYHYMIQKHPTTNPQITSERLNGRVLYQNAKPITYYEQLEEYKKNPNLKRYFATYKQSKLSKQKVELIENYLNCEASVKGIERYIVSALKCRLNTVDQILR